MMNVVDMSDFAAVVRDNDWVPVTAGDGQYFAPTAGDEDG